MEIGAIVFYRITNTHSRNRIIDELLTARYGKRYDAYWNGTPNTPNSTGMFGIIRQLDQSRNEIVHWHVTVRFQPRGAPTGQPTIGLMKPDLWPVTFDQDRRAISSEELRDFCGKAGFVARSLGLFYLKLQGSLEPPHEAHATWQQIFSQPASYPPPEDHPLFLIPSEPGSQPLPSGE